MYQQWTYQWSNESKRKIGWPWVDKLSPERVIILSRGLIHEFNGRKSGDKKSQHGKTEGNGDLLVRGFS